MCERNMTNRERLEKMTDEELAEFICKQHVMCLNCVGRDMCCTNGNGALVWLESEAEEEDE